MHGGLVHEPLRPLVPVTLLPDQYSDRSRAMTLLRRIDTIEIHEILKRDGVRHYAIEIFYKPPTLGIPTNANFKTRCHKATPDVRVLRRFSEFTNFSNEMYFHAHAGHDKSPCSFCASYVQYATTSATQPRLAMQLLHRKDQVRRLLEWFLNDVLRMTVRGVKAYGGRNCLGQEHVPQLLLEFLLPHEVSSLGTPALNLSIQALRHANEARPRVEPLAL